MKIIKILHIIYILEIIISTYIHKNNIFKIIFFISFFTYSSLLYFILYKYNKKNLKYLVLIEKYNLLLEKYSNILNDNYNLKKQIKKYDIPIHIKIQYIDYLISKKHNCSICLTRIEKNDNVFLTICGHLYHNECINNEGNKSDKCPICRKYIIDVYYENEENYEENDDEYEEEIEQFEEEIEQIEEEINNIEEEIDIIEENINNQEEMIN